MISKKIYRKGSSSKMYCKLLKLNFFGLSLSVLPIIKAASKAHRLYSRSCPNFAILFLQYYPVSYLWDHCNNLTTGSHNHCSLFPMFFQRIKKSGLFTASLYYFITSSSFSSYLKSNLLI